LEAAGADRCREEGGSCGGTLLLQWLPAFLFALQVRADLWWTRLDVVVRYGGTVQKRWCRCVNLVRSRYSRWRIAGHGGSVAGAVHVFRSVEHESSALAGEDAETLQWSTTGVNAARNWRFNCCDGDAVLVQWRR